MPDKALHGRVADEMNPHLHRGITVQPIRKRDLDGLVDLHIEFEQFLAGIEKQRNQHSRASYRQRLESHGFGKHRFFNGFVAKKTGRPIGYVFYHFGYDPDEMRGPVYYVIDLYVSASERNKGIGSLLMSSVASVCRKNNGIDIYFGVWTRNQPAIRFYAKLGAVPVREVPFMRWKKAHWPSFERRRRKRERETT